MQRRTFLRLAAVSAGAFIATLEGLPLMASAKTEPFPTFLTFDAGFSTKNDLSGPTIDVLDALLKYKVSATFFPNGRNLQEWEGAVLARMLNEGHAIGNRLWQDQGNTVADQSASTLLAAQYLKTEKRIRALIAAANPDAAKLYAAQPKLYRRPGGDKTLSAFLDPANFDTLSREPYLKPYADVLDWLKTVYDYSGWHVSAGNDPKTKPKSGYALMRRIMVGSKDEQGAAAFMCITTSGKRALEITQGLVIQMNDGDKLTVQALPQIILQLRAKGAEFHVLPRPQDKPNLAILGVEDPPTLDPDGAVCN